MDSCTSSVVAIICFPKTNQKHGRRDTRPSAQRPTVLDATGQPPPLYMADYPRTFSLKYATSASFRFSTASIGPSCICAKPHSRSQAATRLARPIATLAVEAAPRRLRIRAASVDTR